MPVTIAPEGRVLVFAAFIAAAAATVAWGGYSWPLWIILLFVAQFFREPARKINADEAAILSPADGRVVFVGRSQSPDGSDSLKISVFMNVFNVHANRVPTGGEVLESRRFPGSFFNAALDKASEQNERHLIVINSKYGRIACMQVAGLLARRVLCYAKEGDVLTTGQRYGFIRFGSRADLYLPPHLMPQVVLGDHVYAGITRVATE